MNVQPQQQLDYVTRAIADHKLVLVIEPSVTGMVQISVYKSTISDQDLVSRGNDYFSLRALLYSIELALGVIFNRNGS